MLFYIELIQTCRRVVVVACHGRCRPTGGAKNSKGARRPHYGYHGI